VTANGASQNVSRLVTLVQAGANSDIISSPAATTSVNLGATGTGPSDYPPLRKLGSNALPGVAFW
jgi:hypothetical protein